MHQYYKIAGLIVKMETFGRTANLALPYRIKDCECEDLVLENDYTLLKGAYPESLDDSCEYIIKGNEFSHKLVNFGGMILHASAVVMDGRAYLFTADSGVGKSTHTSLWRQVFGDERVRILNDDKPALRFEKDCWYAYGTPWSGKYGQSLNLRYPVGGICFLQQAAENKIDRYTKSDLIFRLMKQTHRTNQGAYDGKVLGHIENLINHVPIWHMKCNMEPEAALLSHQMMSEVAE